MPPHPTVSVVLLRVPLFLSPHTPTPAAHSSFLFSSDRILAALGTSLLSRSEALAPLCTSLDELSVSASVGHGRLVLLQAAARLFVGLWQRPGAREEMLQLDVSQELVSCCLQVRVEGVVGWLLVEPVPARAHAAAVVGDAAPTLVHHRSPL